MESARLRFFYNQRKSALEGYKPIFLVLLGVSLGASFSMPENASIGFIALRPFWQLIAVVMIAGWHKSNTALEWLNSSYIDLLRREEEKQHVLDIDRYMNQVRSVEYLCKEGFWDTFH